MDISIIILNYKSKGNVLNCVKSIKEADMEGLHYEIIVVDNASEDSIGQILEWQYPDVVFIQNGRNLGHGAGNNVGLKRARGEYSIIANADTIVFKDTIKKLHRFIKAGTKVGMAGPKQLSPDKKVQDSCFRWHGLLTPLYRRTPLGKLKIARKDLNRFLMKDFDRQAAREVDWLLGSFMFCRSEALKQAGYFDERYFLYFEDTDLCRRLWQNGWKVVYYPQAEIIHNHARTSAQVKWYKFFTSRTARHHIISWVKYLIKWKGK